MAEPRKLGNFELLERIGQGGMGTVFKARQISMDRIVALKILPPSLAKQPAFTERFIREARASARVNHPNIVGGIDVGQDGGVYYFAMEFVDGLNVKEIIAKGKLSEERALKIGKAMALALAHAHSQGLVHRDVKPDNILIDKSGTPKLCDLGLARLESQSEADKALTQEGIALGTPHYIAPEQARGQHDLDAKTDLYSLGATLYHLLTGKTMFDGETHVVVMTKHVTEKCPHPNDVGAQASKGMVAVLAKLLAKDRADRYESADKLGADLDRVAQGKLPLHADLPPAKSPFTGGAVLSVPTKKPAATGPVAPVEKTSRTWRREARPSAAPAGASLVVPLGLAGAGIIVLLLLLGGGKRLPTAVSAGAKARPARDVAAGAPGQPSPGLPAAALPPKRGPAQTIKPVAPRPVEAPSAAVEPPVVPLPATQPAAAATGAGADVKTDTPVASTVQAAGAAPPAAKGKKQDDQDKIAPGPELAGLIAKARALSAESKFREAAELFKLAPAKLEALDAFDRELAAIHAAGFTGLAGMKSLVVDQLKAEPNKVEAKSVLAKAPGGKLAGGDEKSLFIKDRGVDLPYKWDRLSLEDLYTLNSLVLGHIPDGISLGLGVAAYDQNAEKDDALARKALAGATTPAARRILELIVLRDKVTIAKKQAVLNAYAEKLFYELDEALAAGRFSGVAAKIGLLRTRYADAEITRQRAAGLDALVEVAKVAEQTGAGLEPGNVALASNGATCTGSPNAAKLIDGNATEYDLSSGYAHLIFPGEFIVTLPKVCLLRQVRVLLWDGGLERFYRYAVETSHDGQRYTPLVDRSTGQWRSWQQLDFAPRPVKAIKLKGLYNSSNSAFHAVELEAYCIPPATPVKPKVEEP